MDSTSGSRISFELTGGKIYRCTLNGMALQVFIYLFNAYHLHGVNFITVSVACLVFSFCILISESNRLFVTSFFCRTWRWISTSADALTVTCDCERISIKVFQHYKVYKCIHKHVKISQWMKKQTVTTDYL